MSKESGYIESFELREQDRWLPIANVERVMRGCLPVNAKISKEAKECMQECVSEFISFITSQGAEKCSIEKRKTLNGEDILYSFYSLGFENYAEVLRIYLAKYRVYELDEVEKRRRKYLAKKERMKLQKMQKEGANKSGLASESTPLSVSASAASSSSPELEGTPVERVKEEHFSSPITTSVSPRSGDQRNQRNQRNETQPNVSYQRRLSIPDLLTTSIQAEPDEFMTADMYWSALDGEDIDNMIDNTGR